MEQPVARREQALAAVLWPWLRWRSRPGLVRRAMDCLPYERAPSPGLPRVRVAVAQFDINLASSVGAYVRRAQAMVRQAVAGGASLVLFPEYASLPLLGLLPGASALASRVAGAAHEEGAGAGDGGSGVMGLALRLVAPAARRVYLATFSGLAARFQVTLLAGSVIEPMDGRLRNVAHLFGPDGALLARQVKTHLVPIEVAMDYAVADEIVVANTPAGRLAFPVCMDHTYFETARIAALSGADLLIDPAANTEYYNPYAQARGVWNRVQEVQSYGALACGVGLVAGKVFQGKSGLYAPLDLTPAADGILAEARTPDQTEIVIADLDYEALRAYRREHPLEFNLALYRRYLPAAYRHRPGR